MSISVEIEYLSKVIDESLDYENLIFRVSAVNVLDMGESDKMWTLLKTLAAGGVLHVIVDMDGLEFIDSAGIGVLINVAKLLRTAKGDIVLINVSQRIENIFNPVKLQRFIKVFNSREEAVKYFQLL